MPRLNIGEARNAEHAHGLLQLGNIMVHEALHSEPAEAHRHNGNGSADEHRVGAAAPDDGLN